jgi:hypothetical protein
MKITGCEISDGEKKQLEAIKKAGGVCTELSCKYCPLWVLCTGVIRLRRHTIATKLLEAAKVVK